MRLFEGTEFDVPPRCERCNELESDCQCPPIAPNRIPPDKQTARLSVEKRKKGKQVCTVRDLNELDLADILTTLKNRCGAGGTIKDGTIEIQGQHLDRIRECLTELGYRVKE